MLKKAFQLNKFCKSAGDGDVAHIQKAALANMKAKRLKDEHANISERESQTSYMSHFC